jgi:hypothetical protein
VATADAAVATAAAEAEKHRTTRGSETRTEPRPPLGWRLMVKEDRPAALVALVGAVAAEAAIEERKMWLWER